MPSTVRLPRPQRRAQLLTVATESFGRHGYPGVSMEDIATSAGVTKPVLYQHFSSKEALYEAVVEALGSVLLTEIAALAQVDGDPADRVRHGLRRFHDLTPVEGALRLLTGGGEVSRSVQARVTGILDRAAVDLAGVLSPGDPDEHEARIVGRTLLAVARSTSHLVREAAPGPERDRVLDTTTALVLHGLGGRDAHRAAGSGTPGSDA